jgi:hypothetical protein
MAQGLAAAAPVQSAITEAALDYWASWDYGDPARLERGVHPDLAKRQVRPNDSTSHPGRLGTFSSS